ncbi:hypothetical protein H0H87_007025 [Tephrocybe sp. NHM501043]|nr:hypothetical protein H0H87_007025 [Tephrocybe sp. NHM501043]
MRFSALPEKTGEAEIPLKPMPAPIVPVQVIKSLTTSPPVVLGKVSSIFSWKRKKGISKEELKSPLVLSQAVLSVKSTISPYPTYCGLEKSMVLGGGSVVEPVSYDPTTATQAVSSAKSTVSPHMTPTSKASQALDIGSFPEIGSCNSPHLSGSSGSAFEYPLVFAHDDSHGSSPEKPTVLGNDDEDVILDTQTPADLLDLHTVTAAASLTYVQKAEITWTHPVDLIPSSPPAPSAPLSIKSEDMEDGSILALTSPETGDSNHGNTLLGKSGHRFGTETTYKKRARDDQDNADTPARHTRPRASNCIAFSEGQNVTEHNRIEHHLVANTTFPSVPETKHSDNANTSIGNYGHKTDSAKPSKKRAHNDQNDINGHTRGTRGRASDYIIFPEGKVVIERNRIKYHLVDNASTSLGKHETSHETGSIEKSTKKRACDDQEDIDGPARRTRSRASNCIAFPEGQNVIERNGIKHHLVAGPSRTTFPFVNSKNGQPIPPFNHFAKLPRRHPQGLRREYGFYHGSHFENAWMPEFGQYDRPPMTIEETLSPWHPNAAASSTSTSAAPASTSTSPSVPSSAAVSNNTAPVIHSSSTSLAPSASSSPSRRC